MSAVLTEIINLLVAGITGIASGIGGGLQALVEAIFVNIDATTGAMSLSLYGGLIVCFAGLSLAISLCTRVVVWVENMGK